MERATWPFPTGDAGLKTGVLREWPANTERDPSKWAARCAARLRTLVQDEGVCDDDLLNLARDLAELPAYAALEPEAAAESHVLREA